MNLKQMRVKTLQVMREYSNNGEVNSNSVNLDYLLSFNNFFDTAQKDIAQTKKIKRVFPFSQFPLVSGLSDSTGFSMTRKTTDDYIVSLAEATSYTFKTDNVSTIYVEELKSGSWTLQDTLTNSERGSFKRFYGLLTPSDSTNTTRLRFSGDYAYNIKDFAMFTDPLASEDDIPDFSAYVEIDMPSTFYKLDKVFVESDGVYREFTNYKFTPDKKLKISYFEYGNFEVHYDAMPEDIAYDATDITVGEDYEFELDIEAQELIPLLASYYALRDEPKVDLTSLLSEYYIKLNNLDPDEGQYNEEVQAVYRM